MNELRKGIMSNLYYILIASLSLLVLIIFPFLGSDLNASFKLPQTADAWIVYIATKAAITGVNLLIFHNFVQQARLNVRENERYKRACELYYTAKKEKAPRSPRKYFGSLYASRIPGVIASTILGLIAFGDAILRLDYTALITYGITVVMTVAFGILQMIKVMDYWIEEFPQYVDMAVEAENSAQERMNGIDPHSSTEKSKNQIQSKI